MFNNRTRGSFLAHMMALVAGMGMDTNGLMSKSKLEDIDIDKEYELIKQKKSGLSASMRKLVLSCFDK